MNIKVRMSGWSVKISRDGRGPSGNFQLGKPYATSDTSYLCYLVVMTVRH